MICHKPCIGIVLLLAFPCPNLARWMPLVAAAAPLLPLLCHRLSFVLRRPWFRPRVITWAATRLESVTTRGIRGIFCRRFPFLAGRASFQAGCTTADIFLGRKANTFRRADLLPLGAFYVFPHHSIIQGRCLNVY